MTATRALAAAGLAFFGLVLGLSLLDNPAQTGFAGIVLLGLVVARRRLSPHPATERLRRLRPGHVVALGIVLRFVWAAFAQLQPVSDFAAFWNAAGAFAADPLHVLGTTKSPGAVLYYSGLRAAFGSSLVAVHLGNALLGGLQILLVHRIARRLLGEPAALAAASIFAVFPSLVLFSGVVSSEAPFLCWLLLGMWLMLRAGDDPAGNAPNVGGRASFIAGTAAFALAHLTRAVGGVMWLTSLIECAGRTPRPKRARAVATSVSIFALLCIPQVLSNQRIYGWPLPMPSIYGDLNLLFGTNQESVGQWNREDIERTSSMGGSLTPPHIREFMTNARSAALERIADDPLGFLGFALREKFPVMWSSDRGGADWTSVSSPRFPEGGGRPVDAPLRRKDLVRVSNVFYLCVCFGALLTCGSAVQRRDTSAPPPRALVPLLLPVLGVALLHVLLEVQPRYHLVVLPHFAMLAGAALAGRAAESGYSGARSRAIVPLTGA